LLPRTFQDQAISNLLPLVHWHVNTMRWPPWYSNSSRDDDDKKSRSVSWTESLNATDWSHYTDPRTIVPTLLTTSTILLSVRVYRSYLRRIPQATYIRPGFFRKRSLFGTVTRVGDADNFHLFHTPGGRLTGWGWLPGRKVPEKKADLKGKTVLLRSIRVEISFILILYLDTRPYCGNRRARRCTFRQTGSTLLCRSSRMA